MKISDDIRPKQNKKTEIEEPEKEDEAPKEDGELVSIKHGEDHDFVETDIEEQKLAEEQKKSEHDDLKDYFYTDHNGKDYTEKKKKPKGGSLGKWLVFLLILALVLIIVWQNLDSIKSYFGIKSSDSSSTDSTEPYSDFSVTDSGTAADTSGTAAESSAATDTSSAETDAAAAPAKSSYSVSVLNGNGIKGSAAAVTSSLTAAGYTVSHTGNALKFSYTDTLIYYKTGKSSAATDVKSVLSDRTCELLEDNTITGKYDIVIVVGKN